MRELVCLLAATIVFVRADYPCEGCPSHIGNQQVCWDPKCADGGAGCNAGGSGQLCRYCSFNPDAVHCQGYTGSPTGTTATPCIGCPSDIGGQPICWDPSCSGVAPPSGCMAGGKVANCRFCSFDPSLRHCKSIPVPSTTPWTHPPGWSSTASPTTTSSDNRCNGPDPLGQSQCSSTEAFQNCNCPDNTYCCLAGATQGGCSNQPWTAPGCTCACQVKPLPVPNCTWQQFLFSPCPKSAPYYCPSTDGCAPQRYRCKDLCFLTATPPYPPRPANKHNYVPSSSLTPQAGSCGPATVTPAPACATQPNQPDWSHAGKRRSDCARYGWWCPGGKAGWAPSKFQCGATMSGDDALCPLAQLQSEDARVAPEYAPPPWAPQLKGASSFCDTNCDCDQKSRASECVGCCLWDNPKLKCLNYWEEGQGDKCTKVSPRWNWIITTCDTMGGIDGGGACMQNPFSTVDVRYVAAYQLARTDAGNFVWRIVPDSSLNWEGRTELVDFSQLPTEHTVGRNGGPVRSCSGGGGGWNGAFFPYNNNGVTPPAMMFVLSYKRFYNAAWFMLNTRILDGGPALPTTNSMTNCWGEISAGEIDFLETPNLFPSKFQNQKGWNVYRTTSYNAANRCLACNHGTLNGTYSIAGCGGEPAKSWYDANAESEEEHGHYWAAVVDARGTTVYKDPVWPGMSASCTAPELVNLHPEEPEQQQPCSDPTKTCAVYLPGCVTDPSEAMVSLTGGDYSRIPQCYPVDWATHTTCTNNWWDLMVDTGQWMVKDPPVL